MDAYDVLHGPVTPDVYRIREHYRIQRNIAAMRRDAEEESLRSENERLKAENEALKRSSNISITVKKDRGTNNLQEK